MTGFSNYTNCIHCNDLQLIEQTLTCILEQEGCYRIPLPAFPPPVTEELRRNPWHLCHELWVVGLFVGTSGWTIIKTFPEKLLCRQARGINRPWLSELAMQVGSDAFYLGVYETIRGGLREAILMEADAKGRTFISGSVDFEYSKEGKFFDEQINSQENGQFFLLDVPEEMQRAKRVLEEEQTRMIKEEQRKCEELMAWYKIIQFKEEEEEQSSPQEGRKQLSIKEILKIISGLEFEIQDLNEGIHRCGFQLFDEVIGRLLGGSHSHWYLENLAYQVYTKLQQLEADGARLLYFQPPTTQSLAEDNSTHNTERGLIEEADEDDIPW